MNLRYLIPIISVVSFFYSALVFPQNLPIGQTGQIKKGSVEYFKAILEAKIAYQKGDYPQALNLLNKIVSADPDHIDSWNLLGVIYLKQFSYVLAENSFENVIDIDPGYMPAYQGVAAAKEGLGKYKDALMNYDFFIKNFSGEGRDFAVFRTAELLCRLGKYYDAIPLYEELASNQKSDFSKKSSYYLENIKKNIAKFNGRRNILNGVPHIVPQYNNCMPSALASALIYWGEPTSSKELAQYLMDTQEGGFIIDMIDYTRKLGYSVILSRGSINDIEHWIGLGVPVIVNQVLKKPNQPDVVHLRAIFGYDMIKQSVFSSDMFEIPCNEFLDSWKLAGNMMVLIIPKSKKSLLPERMPEDLEYIARADRYYSRGKYESAYKYYLEAEIDNDTNPIAKFGQAKSLVKINKVDKAAEQLKDLISSYPNIQEAYFLLGVIYFNKNDKENAFFYLKKCISMDTKLIPEAHNFLGYLYVQDGKLNEGIDELNLSLSLKPDYISPHYNLARAYAKMGNEPKAIEHIKKCLDAGFVKFEDISQDPFFKSIQNNPELKKQRDKK